MKSYNGLFAKMFEKGEMEAAIVDASRHKTTRPHVARVLAEKDAKADEIRAKLLSGHWYPPRHETHRLQENGNRKVRQITRPRFDDAQIVHHALMRQLKPIILPRLYRYAYGSLPGRGTHNAVKVMTQWLRRYGRKRVYAFEGDVKKFYDSVDTELLKSMLARRIRDKAYLALLYRVIDTAAPGLPKGYYTSPWLSNLYMEGLDSYIVQTLKPDHYLRYADNLFIIHRNKRELHRMVDAVEVYLRDALHLQLKEDWQVYRFEHHDPRTGKTSGRAVNALGYVIHHDRVGVRKRALKGARAKANHIHRRHRYTRHDAASMISRAGILKHANAYRHYERWIKPKVSLRYCKRRVREADRKKGATHDRLDGSPRQQDGTATRHRHHQQHHHRL